MGIYEGLIVVYGGLWESMDKCEYESVYDYYGSLYMFKGVYGGSCININMLLSLGVYGELTD